MTDDVAYQVEIEDTVEFTVPIDLVDVLAGTVGSTCAITTATVELASAPDFVSVVASTG